MNDNKNKVRMKSDPIHILMRIPAKLSVSDLMRFLKESSGGMIHESQI